MYRAHAPTPEAVWLGGSDGNFVECRAQLDDECPFRCSFYNFDGVLLNRTCLVCDIEGGCSMFDFQDCRSFVSTNLDEVCLANGACLVPVLARRAVAEPREGATMDASRSGPDRREP